MVSRLMWSIMLTLFITLMFAIILCSMVKNEIKAFIDYRKISGFDYEDKYGTIWATYNWVRRNIKVWFWRLFFFILSELLRRFWA